ncbi:MAG TPA: cohesin domain-containing protein, partial [Pirellulaceae bacterium]
LTLGSVVDPGDDTVTNYRVYWGDGLFDDYTPVQITSMLGVVTHTYVDDDPTGTMADLHTIMVDLTDEDGTFTAGTKNLTVHNLDPTAITVSVPSINEGSMGTITVTSVSDPGTADTFTYSFVVKKNMVTFATSGGFVASNSFAFTPDDMDPGFTWTVEVQAKDDDGGLSPIDMQSINVVDVAPTVRIISFTPNPVNENSSTTMVFRLVDPGLGDLAATGQVSVNWGDGSLPTIINSGPQLAALQAGSTVSLMHTYVDDNPPGTSSDPYAVIFTSVQLSPMLNFPGMGLDGLSIPNIVTVNNLAPTGVFLTSTPSVPAGSPVSVNWIAQSDPSPDDVPGLRYTYFIDGNANNMLDLGEEIIPAVTFGDGTYAGSTSSASAVIPGSYFVTPGVYRVASMLLDDDGGVVTSFQNINVTPVSFRVANMTPTDTGFVITFNRAADTVPVNLYAGRISTAPFLSTDTADVTLTGSGGVGNVKGSIVWNAARTSFEFIKTGGVLVAANYSILLESGNTAFQDLIGDDLDGNNDNLAGDNYTANFNVAASAARIVSIPDFSRGATTTNGQVISLPFGNSPLGIPITLSDGLNISAVDLDVVYDPNLLDITSVVAGADTPGWTVTVNLMTSGRAIITLFNVSGLTAGSKEIARIMANVDAGAAYGASEILRIENLAVYEFGNPTAVASKADSGIHKAIFVGDVNASGFYSGLDAGWIAEVRVGLFTGFGDYPLTDPVVCADVTQNGVIDGLDSSWVSQKGLLAALRPEIPNIPAGMLPLQSSVDPTLAIPLNVLGSQGQFVNVPLNITDSAVGLNGFNVVVNYITAILDLNAGLNAGSISVSGIFAMEGGWTLDSYVDETTGFAALSYYRIGDSTSGAGEIGNFNYYISPLAPVGVTPLDVSGPLLDPPFAYNYVDGSIRILPNGDFDDDGFYNCVDINSLTAAIAGGTNPTAFDLDGDNLVNLADQSLWLAEAGAANLMSMNAYILGDANLDGVVDGSDFNVWNMHKFTVNSAWCDGNFNGDAVIDGGDFNVWNMNKFTSALRPSGIHASTPTAADLETQVIHVGNQAPLEPMAGFRQSPANPIAVDEAVRSMKLPAPDASRNFATTKINRAARKTAAEKPSGQRSEWFDLALEGWE